MIRGYRFTRKGQYHQISLWQMTVDTVAMRERRVIGAPLGLFRARTTESMSWMLCGGPKSLCSQQPPAPPSTDHHTPSNHSSNSHISRLAWGKNENETEEHWRTLILTGDDLMCSDKGNVGATMPFRNVGGSQRIHIELVSNGWVARKGFWGSGPDLLGTGEGI